MQNNLAASFNNTNSNISPKRLNVNSDINFQGSFQDNNIKTSFNNPTFNQNSNQNNFGQIQGTTTTTTNVQSNESNFNSFPFDQKNILAAVVNYSTSY